MLFDVVLLSAIGLIICIYGMSAEQQIKKDRSSKVACDISDRISCTRAFMSPYSKLLGISNLYVGIAFYVGMIILAFGGYAKVAFLGAVVAAIGSVFLAYFLYAKVKTLCLLCTSIYLVNALLLILTYQHL